jgi:predicted TIM-barrel fold metal-dependent hydrolase
MCAHDLPTRFEDLFALERLPYFQREDGRLKLADRALGPSIDFHTHLSLAYVRRNRVDLHKLHPVTQNYLPHERSFSLDNYLNKNLTKEDLKRLQRDLTLKSLGAGGMRATHTAANLARDMDDLHIAHSVLLPIDFPWLSDNAGTWLQAVAGDPRFLCYGSVHPFARGRAARLDRQRALGATGLKLHPNIQAVAPEGERAMQLYRMCEERRMIVFWHCGPVGIEPLHGRILTQVRRYERPIRELRGCTFVLGHAGALQNEEALELARRHENVYLEISGQSIERIRRMIERGPVERMVFGTDWPWYHQAIGLAKVYLATEGNERARRAILWDNAARLLGVGRAN